MNPVADLLSAQQALIAAIDGGDVAAIEAAHAAVETAVLRVRAQGAWRDTPELRSDVAQALQENEAARVRVRYHGDRTRTRLERVVQLRGDSASRYDRAGGLSYRIA
jgi:hypothetical protein